MPTYSYACTECDHAFDIRQSFSDDPLTECPECHGRLRKVIHPVGIAFKGSGFYKTDSRPSSGKGSGTGGTSGTATKDSGSASSDTGAPGTGSGTSSSGAGKASTSGSSTNSTGS